VAAGCSSPATSESQGNAANGAGDTGDTGTVGMSLTIPGGEQVNAIQWTITGPNGASTVVKSGTVNVQNSAAVSFQVGGIPVGGGYTVTLSGSSTDGSVSCLGSSGFAVMTRATTNVSVVLVCNAAASEAGSSAIHGQTYDCPFVNGLSAAPAETTVGHSVTVSGSAIGPNPAALTYAWSAPSGSFDTPAAAQANYTCAAAGPVTLTLTASDGAVPDGGSCTGNTQSVQVQCDPASDAGTTFTTMDLSKYVRVGRFDLPEPTRTTPPDGTSLLAQEASAVTYDWDTDTLFVVGDGGTSVVQVTKTGALIDSMTLAPGGSPQGTEFYDTEGISYQGGGKFVLIEERYRQANLFTYVAGKTLQRADVQTVKLGTTIGNIGLEGVTWDPESGQYIFIKEKDPRGIFQTGIDWAAGTATNGSPTTDESVNLFDPALVSTIDFSDVFALSNLPSLMGDPTYDQLLIISQESGQVVQVDRAGGVKHTMTIVADPSDTISVPDMTMEGVTMDRAGILYVDNEDGGGDVNHPQLWVYAPSSTPDLAPTAVTLKGAVTSLPENTSTLDPVKVADIFVADDGQGDNNLSVSGPDAASFQVIGTALFLKAGTTLRAATQSSYQVTVNVDDTKVGATPDASTSYTLAITPGPTGPVTLAVTEVAPWSSGNSPLAADWFELTNFGASAISLTGWMMDDNSNSFAVSVPLNGVASIGPGESVVFIETASSSGLAAAAQSFINLWYGGTAPAGLQIGSYSGSGVGLSTGGDAVNVFDNGGTLFAAVSFGASPGGPSFPTFDNSAGLNNAAITNLSVVGTFGAFAAPGDANEIGSPGTVGSSSTPKAAALVISEVAPWSSGSSPLAADWFEVTNTGTAAADITGWKMDDNSHSFANAVALNGITSIAPGEAVIFIETSDLTTLASTFRSLWFGSNPPRVTQIGAYEGSGVGLSTSADEVTLWDAGGTLRAGVGFGASPTGPFATFDNHAGVNGTSIPLPVISTLSAIGTNGAFAAPGDASEIGSPGVGN
jgi:uncharacterized protein YjiK